jgi:hypothetical protein
MKAETTKTIRSGESTPAPTPEGAVTPDVSEDQESSNGETLHASSTSVHSTSSKGKQKAKDSQAPEDKGEKEATAGNIVGKINNLVTTDLANITNARDFMFLGLLQYLFFLLNV